jgi:hypothetical protein
MIVLNKQSSADIFLVTLTENMTLNTPNFLFVFKNVTTKEIVNKIFTFAEDTSPHQLRFNQFTINTSSVFANQKAGQWIYKVYEQASDTNTDTTGLNMLENGKLLINEDARFEFIGHAPSSNFKGYAG